MHVSSTLRTGAAILGLMAAALLSGCGNNDNTSSSDNAPPVPSRTTDRSTSVSNAGTSSDNSPENFLKKAAMADTTEVQLGELAKSRATSPEVKKFAQQMIDDHSKNLEQVKQLAARKNITLPTSTEPEEQGDKAKLEKLNGADFDQAYAKDMVQDHTKDVAEFENMSKTLQDPDVKSYAEQTLPILKHHLQMARDMNDKLMKSSGQATGEKTSEQPVQTKRETEPQPAR